MNVLVAEKKQFKLWLEPESIDRLTVAGKRFGRSSAQEVVEELIAVYLPTWSAVNESMRRAIAFQTKLAGDSELLVNTPPRGVPVAPHSKNPILIKTEKSKQRKTG